MRVLKEGLRIPVDFWCLAGNEVTKVRSKNGIIKITFKDFFARFAAG
jgi:hypothetical protein